MSLRFVTHAGRRSFAISAAVVSIFVATDALADSATKNLLGIWARNEADCQTKLSGRLDNAEAGSSGKSYEFLGFCQAGMELLYQPVRCKTGQIQSVKGGYRWSGSCQVKDYEYRPLEFSIKADGDTAISFDEKDFDGADFSVDGSYVRCSLTYKCEE